jgi:hypothetical protein
LLFICLPSLLDLQWLPYSKKCVTLDDHIIEEACTRNSFKYLTSLSRAIDPWSVHGCVGFPIPVSG